MQTEHHNPQSTKPVKGDYVGWLNYGIYCRDRAEAAEWRAYNAGDSLTGDRHRATAYNWMEKSEGAFDIVREKLKTINA
jgi:hypothetical protein